MLTTRAAMQSHSSPTSSLRVTRHACPTSTPRDTNKLSMQPYLASVYRLSRVATSRVHDLSLQHNPALLRHARPRSSSGSPGSTTSRRHHRWRTKTARHRRSSRTRSHTHSRRNRRRRGAGTLLPSTEDNRVGIQSGTENYSRS
jgi:hypothetical protein